MIENATYNDTLLKFGIIPDGREPCNIEENVLKYYNTSAVLNYEPWPNGIVPYIINDKYFQRVEIELIVGDN